MKKLSLFAILLTGCIMTSFAQNDATNPIPGKKEKQTDQFIGVQLNSLIRQVFNFNNSPTTTLTNPYLINYNINSRKTGWGLRVGLGYNYNSASNSDGITDFTSKINDLSMRIGIEKAFKLSEKWSAGAGADLLVNFNDDNSISTVHSFDTVVTDTKTKTTSYGGGAMGWLRYHITDKITIGTEASIYYTTGTQENTVAITNKFSGGFGTSTTTTTTSKPTISQANINLPIVFFLAVRF